MIGFRPSPPVLARPAPGWSPGEGKQQCDDDSLSIYRSNVRPVSSRGVKSCTRLISPLTAPARAPHLNVFQIFQMVYLSYFFFFLSLLHHCLLLAFVISSARVSLSIVLFLIDLSFHSCFLSAASSVILGTSVIVIMARLDQMAHKLLFCSCPPLYC